MANRIKHIASAVMATLLVSALTSAGQTTVRLNEVLAKNDHLPLPDGNLTDWVELYNTSSSPVNLSDSSVSDTVSNPRKFIFGNVTIPGNGFVIVTNLNFKANGDTVYFYDRPANGGGLIDTVTFGLQVSDLTIGRVPNGTGPWVLNQPTRSAGNTALAVGSSATLKVNEWMASPLSGDDWFEIYNPDPRPVALGGLHLTDTLSNNTLYRIRDLSFIGSGLEGYFRFYADDSTNATDRVNFKLGGGGDSLRISTSGGSPIDTVTFGSQTSGVSEGRLPDGGPTIVRFPDTNSPGAPNYLTLSNIVVNEILTHTDPPQEDAVEFQNVSSSPVDISGWYLSNKRGELKRYRIPAGPAIPPGGFRVIYEYQFNGASAASPFTFNSARGDEVYLSQADAAGNLTGYILSEVFESSENGVSFGRYYTSIPGEYKFVAMSSTSFGQDSAASLADFRQGTGRTNASPRVGPVVISEIMFRSTTDTNQEPVEEYVEIRNLLGSPVALFDPQYPTNRWRFQNGIRYTFPANTSLPAFGFGIIVGFDPASNPGALSSFRSKFNVPSSVPIFGPWTGRLSNSGDGVELYKPDPVQLPPHPDAGFVPYIRVDKVNYSATAPWPSGASGTGASLQRKNFLEFGNDPINWATAPPTAGRTSDAGVTDSDGDGMPDAFETTYGLNPSNPADAELDRDGDGMTNLAEYLAGTDPSSGASRLAISAVFTATNAPVVLRFEAQVNKTYTVQYRNSLSTFNWQNLQSVSAGPMRTVEVLDMSGAARFDRYYRVVTPLTK